MSDTCPTVRIKTANGPVRINESKFDPANHELFDASSAPADEAISAEEVLAMAGGNFMAFKSAAAQLLGEDCPAKKNEIVAALEAMAKEPEPKVAAGEGSASGGSE